VLAKVILETPANKPTPLKVDKGLNAIVALPAIPLPPVRIEVLVKLTVLVPVKIPVLRILADGVKVTKLLPSKLPRPVRIEVLVSVI
jgi:hypothetical protein